MRGVATAAACLAIALLTYFEFPGHTWLQQDSQIFVPMLEHLRDPSVLKNDLLVQHPHVAYTLYDEVARLLGGITRSDFHTVLALQQVVTRALGIWGLYLLAGGSGIGAWVVALICSLGATIAGPAVLTIEYEPTPRAFALPLVFCAMGLAARGRYIAAGAAAACAFLYHPPTTVPFWVVFGVLAAMRRRFQPLAPLAMAVVLLTIVARGDGSPLLARVTPELEQLQRMRAPYVWISMWPGARVAEYLVMFAVGAAALWRVRRETSYEVRALLAGLSVSGLISMPLSWLLLERMHWSLLPQFQPMRAVLFIALAMQFSTALAGVAALARARRLEAAGWFLVAYLLPLAPLDGRRMVALAVIVAVTALSTRGWALVPAVAAFFVIPILGGVVNYPQLHTPALTQLATWARGATAPDAVFLFPDAGRSLAPGIFRAEAQRAVYVDWKSGGQVNHFADFAAEWWSRWRQTMSGFQPQDFPRYESLGIAYVVLRPSHRLSRPAAFGNEAFVVYAVGNQTPRPALQSR